MMLFNFEVADFTRSLQSQNGLRHGDYNRYRRLCTRKVHRLKSTLNLSNGRHRYKHVPMPDVINSPKFVQLLVVQAERAWAYAVTLKSEYALGEAKAPGRIRHRYIHKFHRAAHWSRKLLELAQRTCDTRTQLEASAYSLWMIGLALTEAGEYAKAIVHLEDSITSYNELIKDSLDVVFAGSSKAYRHRITDLEPVLRVCKYKLRVGGLAVAAEPTSPKSDFESVNGSAMSVDEFSSSDDEQISASPKKNLLGAVAGKIGGWWSSK